MTEEKKQTEAGATALKEDELQEAQGGFVIANGGALGMKEKQHQSRGNNVFGFEDLPSNLGATRKK